MEDLVIIFIQGVYLSDMGEDESSDEDEISTYDTLPSHFISSECWLKKTDILCSHCGLGHDMVPVFIPQYFKSTTEGIHIAIEKILFCSFPCAATYIQNNYKSSEQENKKTGLKYVYKVFTGEDISNIPLAPRKHEIDAFGGSHATYTISRFRRHLNHLIPFSRYIL